MRLRQPLRARWAAAGSKKVTWLELFFDLVFVAAVAQVASPLHEHYSIDGLLRFAMLFLLIWWAWTGHATFATRFEGDDIVQRVLTVLQMFIVSVMAANATEGLDSRSAAGFAAAYAVMRLTLVVQYFRARRVPQGEELSTRHALGHGAAAALWLASAFTPVPARFLLWTVALAIDLGTPWLTVRHSVDAPPHPEHLPERFGLFTIILLGESVIAVMHGIESQEHWSVQAASAALLGLVTIFTIWWLYFERIDAAGTRHVVSRADAVGFHWWTFAHLPFFVGVITTASGARRVIEADPGMTVPLGEAALLAGGLCLVGAGLSAIRLTGRRDVRRSSGAALGRPQSLSSEVIPNASLRVEPPALVDVQERVRHSTRGLVH